MLMLLRHLLAVAVFPFVMAVVIPVWLARRDHVTLSLAETVPLLLVQVVGGLVLVIGIIPG
ncbi:MAG TPA: hypothetical protein VES88_03235 [Gemmatimonadaceae bacterium]|nr:hypothetical protein [Gemmatimonadaceae bacterium]